MTHISNLRPVSAAKSSVTADDNIMNSLFVVTYNHKFFSLTISFREIPLFAFGLGEEILEDHLFPHVEDEQY